MDKKKVDNPIYICVAGPPASGKTTAVKAIAQALPEVIVHKEINPFWFVKGHLGGAFVDEGLERKILAVSLRRIKGIAKKPGIHLDETGPFHAAFAEIVAPKMAWVFRRQFFRALGEFGIGIIFLQARPEVSWQRRKEYYQKMAKKEAKKQGLKSLRSLKGLREKKIKEFEKEMLVAYRKRIWEAYPRFLRFYEELRFPKIKVLNNGKDVKRFERRVVGAFEGMLANYVQKTVEK